MEDVGMPPAKLRVGDQVFEAVVEADREVLWVRIKGDPWGFVAATFAPTRAWYRSDVCDRLAGHQRGQQEQVICEGRPNVGHWQEFREKVAAHTEVFIPADLAPDWLRDAPVGTDLLERS